MGRPPVSGLALVTAALALAAPSQAQVTSLATVERATPVSSAGGWVVWSAYNAETGMYELTVHKGGMTFKAPVAPRGVPFDAEVGLDARGRPTVVYSRCAVEPRVNGGAVGQLPVWHLGRGCDVWAFSPKSLEEGDVDAVNSDVSEVLPSVSGNRVAFVRVYRSARCGGTPKPTVYVTNLALPTGSKRQADGPRGACPAPEVGDGRSGPTSLDLSPLGLVSAWRYLQGPTRVATQVRFQRVGRAARVLARSAQGESSFVNLVAPSWAGREIQWAAVGDPDEFRQSLERATRTGTRRRSAALPAELETIISQSVDGADTYAAVLSHPEVEGAYATRTRIVRLDAD